MWEKKIERVSIIEKNTISTDFFIMLFSIVSVTPVMADSISGTYTFVDTCYSPELGIYVAVAKDLSSGTTPAQIYVSDNGSDWTLKKHCHRQNISVILIQDK